MFFRGQTIGKYRIDSSLGSGGFGSVYLAEDTFIGKKVAIKVPHKQLGNIEEMAKEPRLLASLGHPNIVTVLTAEKQDDIFFIVMEYVEGETLEAILVREGALSLARALDFTCQICNAIDHAHKVGILHRDIRPGNMLVTPTGMLKVTDFGTSRFLEAMAHGTTIIGSPPWMAPEQFQGRAVFASDVYAIGITMYQMLTGVLPYETPTPRDLERIISGELVVAPRLKNPKIPRAINDIVLKALAPDLAVRYPRAAELLHDIVAVQSRKTRTTAPAPAPFATALSRSAAPAAPVRRLPEDSPAAIQDRVKARDTPQPRFCWQCRKALASRADRCPFCGEKQ
ncbi:MAG: serine/threonine-protein kinase [Vicinamibacterales bacterium]|nr:serine/threonine-protein kinase [Vicinamibacterales bacterium]